MCPREKDVSRFLSIDGMECVVGKALKKVEVLLHFLIYACIAYIVGPAYYLRAGGKGEVEKLTEIKWQNMLPSRWRRASNNVCHRSSLKGVPPLYDSRFDLFFLSRGIIVRTHAPKFIPWPRPEFCSHQKPFTIPAPC